MAFDRPYLLVQFQLIAGEHSRDKQSRYGLEIDNENMSYKHFDRPKMIEWSIPLTGSLKL